MRILGLLLIVGAAVFAQTAERPSEAPAGVDEALRGRVRMFFQAHVDGKPRLADQVVAEDSKDFFFEMQKPRYLSFEIVKIEYSDSFTKATATVNCEQEMMMMGLGMMKVKMPKITTWKLEGGQWFWYFEQKAVRDTPFGKVALAKKDSGGPSTPFQMPKGPDPAQLMGLVKADKAIVNLSSPPASDTVTITNGMPGWVKVVAEHPSLDVPGLEIALDKESVRGGETAKLSIRYDPKGQKAPAESVRVNVRVEPIGKLIPVKIVFATQPQQ